MRASFITLLPAFIALASWTAGFVQAQGPSSSYPREFLDSDELDFGLERREIFIEDLTTRELMNELSSRLERRGNLPSKLKPAKKYACPYCGTKYDTQEGAKACATKSRFEGGCKVGGAVQHVRH